MQMQTARAQQLTVVRMAIRKQTGSDKCQRGGGEKGSLLHRWWECRPVQPLRQAVWNCLRTLRIHVPYDPAIPLRRVDPKNSETLLPKDMCTAEFTTASLPLPKTWKPPWSPARDECRRKMGYSHAMAYQSAGTKDAIQPLVTTRMAVRVLGK